MTDTIDDLKKEIEEKDKKIEVLTQRGLAVKEQNDALSNSVIGEEVAKMDLQLKMANHFVKSGAVPKGMNAEQCFMLMKTGQNMGMSETQSLNSLYIVNGRVQVYQAGLSSILTKNGYKIKFENENEDGVEVVVYNEKTMEEYREEVDRHEDPILKNSKAMSFAPKQKMRWHGIRQICNFYLAHLFTGAEVIDTEDYPSIPYMIKEEKRKEVEEKKELMGGKKMVEVPVSDIPNIFDHAE